MCHCQADSKTANRIYILNNFKNLPMLSSRGRFFQGDGGEIIYNSDASGNGECRDKTSADTRSQ